MKKNRRWHFKKLTNRYRIVILNEKSFEERLAFALTPVNLLLLFGSVFMVFFLLMFLLFRSTPLREYVVDNNGMHYSPELGAALQKVDSLEHLLQAQEDYLANLNSILNGGAGRFEVKRAVDEKELETVKSQEVELFELTPEDSMLRVEVESNMRGGFGNTRGSTPQLVFYPPIQGIITRGFDAGTEHFAVDVVTKADAGVKATLDGTVIFTDWSAGTGHVIVLQHADNLISVYKHNSSVLKNLGNFVRAGEVIAIVGNSGELTQGPHLHFELWQDGRPVNPEQFVAF